MAGRQKEVQHYLQETCRPRKQTHENRPRRTNQTAQKKPGGWARPIKQPRGWGGCSNIETGLVQGKIIKRSVSSGAGPAFLLQLQILVLTDGLLPMCAEAHSGRGGPPACCAASSAAGPVAGRRHVYPHGRHRIVLVTTVPHAHVWSITLVGHCPEHRRRRSQTIVATKPNT